MANEHRIKNIITSELRIDHSSQFWRDQVLFSFPFVFSYSWLYIFMYPSPTALSPSLFLVLSWMRFRHPYIKRNVITLTIALITIFCESKTSILHDLHKTVLSKGKSSFITPLDTLVDGEVCSTFNQTSQRANNILPPRMRNAWYASAVCRPRLRKDSTDVTRVLCGWIGVKHVHYVRCSVP